jgi:hypothetical protein
MNIKRLVICIFLILILSLFLHWLNNTKLEGFHFKKPQFKKINLNKLNINKLNLNKLNLNKLNLNKLNPKTGDKKPHKTTSTPQPLSPYGQGQYGEPQMAQNGYYVDTGVGGGYYYGGGQPSNVKYIYNDIHNFFPFWDKQASFS